MRTIPLGANKIAVFWDADEMTEQNVKNIIVEGEELGGEDGAIRLNVSAHDERVTLRNLKPDTFYKVNVDGYRDETVVFASQRYVKTHAMGELHWVCMRCIS